MSALSVVMLLENNGYPRDVRPRREAEALVDAGFAVTVIAPRDRGEPRMSVVNGVKVKRFRLPAPRAGAAALVLEYVVANAQMTARGLIELMKGATALHLHNPPDTFFPLAWLARLLRRRVVVDLHDLAPELYVEKFGRDGVVRLLLLLERLSVRAAHHVLTVNESLRELVSERDGVPLERISVLRNVPRRREVAAASPPRGGSLPDPRLVFLGSMESQDGVDRLPELMDLLHREFGLTEARLTVIGDGSEKAGVEAEFRRRGLSDHVNFLGYVAHDEVPAHLASADICIEPAPRGPLNDRCSMVKVAEYMAAARPVVCFALPEVVRIAGDAAMYAHGSTVTEMASLVRDLAGDEARRRTLGERGRQRALELTWESSAATLVAVYEQLS